MICSARGRIIEATDDLTDGTEALCDDALDPTRKKKVDFWRRVVGVRDVGGEAAQKRLR